MSNAIVPEIYRQVIQKVIEDVKEDFELNGVDEAYLEDLRITWEKKLYASGVAEFEILEPDEESYFTQTSLPLPAYATHPADEDYRRHSFVSPSPPPPSAINHAISTPSPAPYPFNPNTTPAYPYLSQEGRPATYMPPPKPPLPSIQTPPPPPPPPTALPGLYVQTQSLLKSKASSHPSFRGNPSIPTTTSTAYSPHLYPAATSPPTLPQYDGADDSGEEDFREELNSDLDDSSEEEDENEASHEANNMVLCLYEKVTRTKSKWKCILKDGIIHIHGKDYLFHRATGDFQF